MVRGSTAAAVAAAAILLLLPPLEVPWEVETVSWRCGQREEPVERVSAEHRGQVLSPAEIPREFVALSSLEARGARLLKGGAVTQD